MNLYGFIEEEYRLMPVSGCILWTSTEVHTIRGNLKPNGTEYKEVTERVADNTRQFLLLQLKAKISIVSSIQAVMLIHKINIFKI